MTGTRRAAVGGLLAAVAAGTVVPVGTARSAASAGLRAAAAAWDQGVLKRSSIAA